MEGMGSRREAERVRALGAADVVTASLVSHSWADPMPDAVALVTDALVLFPWDRRVYVDGAWQAHPEVAAALALQGVDAGAMTEDGPFPTGREDE
jgi:uncharacterized protein